MSKIYNFLAKLTQSPAFVPIVLAFAVVLISPSILRGYQLDDYLFDAVAHPTPELSSIHRGPVQLYQLIDGEDVVKHNKRIQEGTLAWHTPKGLQVRFCAHFRRCRYMPI